MTLVLLRKNIKVAAPKQTLYVCHITLALGQHGQSPLRREPARVLRKHFTHPLRISALPHHVPATNLLSLSSSAIHSVHQLTRNHSLPMCVYWPVRRITQQFVRLSVYQLMKCQMSSVNFQLLCYPACKPVHTQYAQQRVPTISTPSFSDVVESHSCVELAPIVN